MSPHEYQPSQHVLDAVTAIVDYLYDDERAHFLGSPSDEREGHIFVDLLVVSAWLAGLMTPRDSS